MHACMQLYRHGGSRVLNYIYLSHAEQLRDGSKLKFKPHTSMYNIKMGYLSWLGSKVSMGLLTFIIQAQFCFPYFRL